MNARDTLSKFNQYQTEFNNGQISKEEFQDLVKDLATQKYIEDTAFDYEANLKLQDEINQLIKVGTFVAGFIPL